MNGLLYDLLDKIGLAPNNVSTDYKRIMDATSAEDLNTILKSLNVEMPQNIKMINEVAAQRGEFLNKQQAAPYAMEAQRLNAIAANDPTVGNAEGLADFAQRPEFWLGAQGGGVLPGGKKKEPVSGEGLNPYTAGIVQSFGQGNQNLLDAYNAPTNPMSAARLMQNKELSNNFKDVQAGLDQINTTAERNWKMSEAAKAEKGNQGFNEAMSVIDGTKYPATPAGFAAYQQDVRDMAANTGQDPKIADEIINREGARWAGMGTEQRPYTLKVGATTKKGGETLNPFGHVISDNNASYTTPAKIEYPSLNVNNNQLTDEQHAAIAKAIAERRLDPYKVNSRNQQMLAYTIMNSPPDTNLNAIAADLELARNKDVQMKGAIAETVPPLLHSIVENGKKLNYSDVQFVGIAQQWMDKKLNNPQLVKYMTLRNDQLLTLGGIMRSNGMTDMAQRLEEEAAHPTMSPKALDGWLAGQMESVDPRLNIYRSIKAGKGTPGAAPAQQQPANKPRFQILQVK